jgi:hypothetical protein
MAALILILAILCIVLGFVSFLVGSLGIGSSRLRKRLPVHSPISLMHAGSIAIFLGMPLFFVAVAIHRLF